MSQQVAERSAFDEYLLANARRPISELAEYVGDTPERVAEKMASLFEDRGWMTERMEERYMLIELGDLIDDAKKQLKFADVKEYASVFGAIVKAMDVLGKRFDSRRRIVDEDLERITRAQSRTFGTAFDVALDHIIKGLIEHLKIDIPVDRVEQLRREGLTQAKRSLEERTSN